MNNINLNLYRIFYVVAKSKSFVEASAKLYISQPAISNDIKTLENVLNTKLIHRKNNGITLTRDGEEFVKYLEEIFGILNIAEKIIKQRNDLSNGVISIGCPSHITSLYLMERIESFKNDYPNVKIQIISSSTDELIQLLEQHKVDFIINTSPRKSIYNNIEVRHVNSFDTVFISNKVIHITELKELENQKWILPFEFTNTRKRLNRTLEQEGIFIKQASLELDTTELIINAVKRNLGIGYVIEDSVKEEIKKGDIYKVNVDIELPKINIYLLNIKGQLTNAAKTLIKYR